MLASFCIVAAEAGAQSGPELMEAHSKKYAPPPDLYEEQVLIIYGSRGNPALITLRHFARIDQSGARSLRVIDTPANAAGTSIHVERDFRTRERRGATATSSAFGSHFTLADLDMEQTADFHFVRDNDQVYGRVMHYVLRAIPADNSVAQRTGSGERLIYLRRDNLFISRIDYRDAAGRSTRRLTFRDPVPDDLGIWRSRMLLMEDLRTGERSLLKTERRILSPDYVPAAIFQRNG